MSQTIKTILQNQIKAAFSLFDKEGNGTIEFKDFGTLMRSIGYDIDEQIAMQMGQKLAAKSGESFIQYSDFKAFYITALNSPEMREDLKQAFEAIDVDKDKLISFSDLKAFLQAADMQRSEQQINEMMSEGDIDGDGMISFEQFLRLMATR